MRFSSRGGLDAELMFSDGMGANILPCWAGGRCEQPMVSPWDFFFFDVVDWSDFTVGFSLYVPCPPKTIGSYEN